MQELELVTSSEVDLSSLLPLSKLQTRVPSAITFEDDLYNLYVPAAIDIIESMAEITLTEKTYNLNKQAWPWPWASFSRIRVETAPVTSIIHIKYYDQYDVQQTLDGDLPQLWLSHNPPEIWIPSDQLPNLSSEISKAVEIQFIAGYNDVASFTPGSQLAILELVAFWYQNRESFGRLPDGVQGKVFQSLIDTLRWRVYP